MKAFQLIFISCVLFFNISVYAAEVIFVIEEGTRENKADWNSVDNPVVAKVGDILTIVNGDVGPHAFHTYDGIPCAHGDVMQPGESWSCELTSVYDAREEEHPTRDHFYAEAKFWLVVEEVADTE